MGTKMRSQMEKYKVASPSRTEYQIETAEQQLAYALCCSTLSARRHVLDAPFV
jgi:hypothetical protein